MTRRKKKPNKAAREKARAERADIFEQGFKHGYGMGYEQGYKEAAQLWDRERRKLALKGQ